MKTIFFSSCYPQYLEYFYQHNRGLENKTYAEQLHAIMNDYFSVWGSYTMMFQKKGHAAEFIIPNCKPLQKSWAKENSIPFDKNWLFSIPLAQVKRSRPDIFFTGSMFEYFGEFLDEVKKLVPNVFGWIACAIPAGVQVNKLDLIVSSLPYYVEQFRKMGISSEWINAAFDPGVLKHIENRSHVTEDFTFIGSYTNAHKKRNELIRALIKETPLVLYGSNVRMLSEQKGLSKWLKKDPLELRMKGETWGLDMFRVLKNSKITLNAHIDISNEFIGNIRMFEATGVGTLLLTDGKNAPNKLFSDTEVVFYNSAEDAIEKANYYLSHDDERKKIAANGQKKTLSVYNYDINSERMIDFFKQYSKSTQRI